MVASKATQIDFADGYVVGNGISKGMAIKTVGSIFRRNPAAMIVLADSAIKIPKDTEGKTVAMAVGSAEFQQWPTFLKRAGVDASKIRVVNIDPAGVGPALISGKVDAIGGDAAGLCAGHRNSRQEMGSASSGTPITALPSFPMGSSCTRTCSRAIPTLFAPSVPPTIKGFLYARQHPDEAATIVKKHLPPLDLTITKRESEVSWQTWVTPNTKGKPLGWGAEADWAATIHVLKQYGGVTTPLETSQPYTNVFVPSGAEYAPPSRPPDRFR